MTTFPTLAGFGQLPNILKPPFLDWAFSVYNLNTLSPGDMAPKTLGTKTRSVNDQINSQGIVNPMIVGRMWKKNPL